MSDQQRDAIKDLSPPWLASGNGERYLYDIGLGLDVILEKGNQANRARMPGLCDPSALPLLAADRVLVQGPAESYAQFCARLTTAFETWQHAGSRSTVLAQILAYLSETSTLTGQYPQAAIVGGVNSATWTTHYTAGPESTVFTSPSVWDWDGQGGTAWWRNWLVLYFQPQPLLSPLGGVAASVSSVLGSHVTITGLAGMSSSTVGQFLRVSSAATDANNGTFQIVAFVSSTSIVIGNPVGGVAPDANNGALAWSVVAYPGIGPGPAWGMSGTAWGDTTRSWGLNVPASTAQMIQALLRRWKSANAYYPWTIFAFGGSDGRAGSDLSPNSSKGTGNPDGTWGRWGKVVAGQRVPARVTGTQQGAFDAFADGTGRYLQSFEQVVT